MIEQVNSMADKAVALLSRNKSNITYEFIADLLRPNYHLVIEKTRYHGGVEKTTGLHFHVNSIVKDTHLDYVKSLLAGMGLHIFYNDNSEDLCIEIPEQKNK